MRYGGAFENGKVVIMLCDELKTRTVDGRKCLSYKILYWHVYTGCEYACLSGWLINLVLGWKIMEYNL